jgi:AhpD family alkylhydroperoxidase
MGLSIAAVKARVFHGRRKLCETLRQSPKVDKFLTKGEPAMKARIDYKNVPEALRAMYQLEHYIHNSGLEESLVHLVKMRASQINGCAYCLDVHSKDARTLGETEQRLFVLDAWEEAAFYSERERAALALQCVYTVRGIVGDAKHQLCTSESLCGGFSPPSKSQGIFFRSEYCKPSAVIASTSPRSAYPFRRRIFADENARSSIPPNMAMMGF